MAAKSHNLFHQPCNLWTYRHLESSEAMDTYAQSHTRTHLQKRTCTHTHTHTHTHLNGKHTQMYPYNSRFLNPSRYISKSRHHQPRQISKVSRFLWMATCGNNQVSQLSI